MDILLFNSSKIFSSSLSVNFAKLHQNKRSRCHKKIGEMKEEVEKLRLQEKLARKSSHQDA